MGSSEVCVRRGGLGKPVGGSEFESSAWVGVN